jgi:NAD dependent epimerase/dehydratase family enzyme
MPERQATWPGHPGQPGLASSTVRRHFGGWISAGRGWTPWIHVADEVGIIVFALEQSGVDGPVNLTAPEPVRARDFARALGGQSAAAPGWRSPARSSGWAWA